jgi:hypothetical protein
MMPKNYSNQRHGILPFGFLLTALRNQTFDAATASGTAASPSASMEGIRICYDGGSRSHPGT